MQLSCRGVEYDYNPISVETNEGQVEGKYRGADWRFRNLKKAPVLIPVSNLKYRGVSYNRGGAVTSESVETAQVSVAATVSFDQKARSLMFNQTHNIKKRQLSMLLRAASNIGSNPDVAKYWNHIQGKVHPSFRASYDRLGGAMS